jgi:alcohol dehydrogenase (cytochrome c)
VNAALALLAVFAQAPSGAVPAARIQNAEAAPEDWLTYSGGYRGHRHSPLAQIDVKNVGRVRPAWVYQSREAGKMETSPLVVDGIVYITEKPHIVTALDGRTGRPLWSYTRPAATGVPGCCGAVNRGLAVLGDALFFGTFDAHLVALDLHTGRLRWDVVVAEPKAGYSLTVAPLAVKDKIVVGVAGGEFGVRGFLDDTWKGDAWKTGGATTWVTGVYDPALDLLYWGTGNPAPNYNGDGRAGDNLYTDCLLALEPDTGKLRWHFQFTPHDLHDWDANQVPLLIDAAIAGQPRKLVAQVNRNAFYYLLDRETGAFLLGAPYTKQTWASGLDTAGRPIPRPGVEPSAAGTLVFPGLAGGTNWYSPAYSPQTKLIYAQVHEDYAQVFHKLPPRYQPGAHFEAGAARDVEGSEHHGAIKAIDPLTGTIRWTFDLYAPPSGGVLSTAGGLVWSGNREGMFFALDARSGAPLWHFQTGGTIWANPIAFAVDGKQHVAIAAGHALFVFALDSPAPH